MTLRGKPVLVTGAGGCIGAFVVRDLLAAGARPVVLELTEDRRRIDLIMPPGESGPLVWEIGDITDFDRLCTAMDAHAVEAVIHLAALQVPFAKADPVLGTRVNVMGSVTILEAARQRGIRRLAYASSIAAPAMREGAEALSTLYGAHKLCGELMAGVYWQDWQTPSIGIRPAVIYGPGRDQGMSAAPTIAMLAACFGLPYVIPFAGPVSFVHVADAAAAFVKAIDEDQDSAPVFDLNGTQYAVEDIVRDIKSLYPQADISCAGAALPFPAEPDDGGLRAHLGLPAYREFARGMEETFAQFDAARKRGDLTEAHVQKLVERN